MHYNRKRVIEQLEEGVDDPTSPMEEMVEFIDNMILRAEANNVESVFGDFIAEWEED